MEDIPPPAVTASGERSVSAEVISGPVATGDHALIDARRIHLAAGAIPLPAEMSLASPVSNLPRPPARVFVGRAAALGLLGDALSQRGGAVVTQAVYGLGGVGKSELALHHAHARRGDYRVVWWVPAAGPAQVEAGLAALAARLCPAIAVAGTTQDAAGWAMGWLQAHSGWLLVLDNVEDPGDIGPLLGQLGSGHVVLTTRRDVDWQRLAVPVRLDILDPGPAAQLITARTGHDTAADQEDAAAIAAELGYLPLALDQAAAYMTQARITPGSYLARLRQHPARMYAAAGTSDAGQTIARLWDITIEAIGDRGPGAVWLLRVMAHYAPDAIPRLMVGGGERGEGIDESLGMLASYSMITLTAETVSIHRLVQAVVLGKPDQAAGDGCGACDTALAWLSAVIPADPGTDVAGWPLLRALVPHAEYLSSHYPRGDRPERLGWVHNQIGLFYRSQGDYAQALALFESALEIGQTVLGPDHPDTAVGLGNLAATHRDLGRAADALPLAQQALEITEAALGPDHPRMAIELGNLAATYRALGQPADALPLERQALEITETALDPDHPRVATRLGNLAATYRALGQPADALPLAQRALRITEAALGPDHPDTAIRLGNLAATYRALGQPADALPLEQRALRITEAALGPDHPDTAIRLGNLAGTYRALGQPADALPLEQRALRITEAALGPDHPDTATLLGNLAATYRALGQAADALPLAQRALQITEAALGPDHPDTAIRLGNLAGTYRALGQPADALPGLGLLQLRPRAK